MSFGIHNGDGYLIYTLVDGLTFVGVYNKENGTFNAVDQTENPNFVGLYHKSGAYNIRIYSEDNPNPIRDGAYLVIDIGNGQVARHPSFPPNMYNYLDWILEDGTWDDTGRWVPVSEWKDS